MRLTTWLNVRLGRWFICYLALVMFMLLLIEITARYAFAAPTVWATELTQMMFAVYIMLSGGYLLAQKGHVNVDIFYTRLSVRGRAVVDVVTSLLFYAFVLVLLKEGWEMAEDSIAQLETSFSAWNPPVWPIKLTIPVGVVLLLLQGVVKLVDDIATIVDPSRVSEVEQGAEGGSL